MKKFNKILVFLALFILGCAETETEIGACNLSIEDGITYKDGKIYSGTCHIIYNNEDVWKTQTYKRGKLSKEIAYHIPEGSIDYIGYRNRDGNIHGDFEKYFKNGNIEVEGQFNKGFYKGKWKYYSEEGELTKEITYNNEGTVIDSITY